MEDKLKQTVQDLVNIINEKEMTITNLRLNNQSLLREINNLKGEEVDAESKSEK
jgi:FtsZ-binding cell division protein ZapB